jgi:DnaK suppressor protein
MEQSEKEALLAIIKEKVEQAIKEIEHLEEMTQPIAPENSLGRISRMDAINNKSVAEAALRSSRKKLNKLRLALAKIDEPGFGTCKLCKGPIPKARLMFMPESTRCVKCADRR